MAYNEFLADRIRLTFKEKPISSEEKKMFGGFCFLVDDKLCCGVFKEEALLSLFAHTTCAIDRFLP